MTIEGILLPLSPASQEEIEKAIAHNIAFAAVSGLD